MVAPLFLTSVSVTYEAGIHSNLFVICVRVKGCMQGTVWIESDKCESMLYVGGQVCGQV